MKEEKKIRKKIKIEDLLPRDPIRVDLDAILGYVKGKTILVTGGGGSIGVRSAASWPDTTSGI